MTTRELIIVSCAYVVALIVVAYFTRATSRRMVGRLCRWRSRRCFRDGRDCPRQCVGFVARADPLDPAVLRGSVFPRSCCLGHANLPRHLASGPPVWLAWTVGLHLHRRDHW